MHLRGPRMQRAPSTDDLESAQDNLSDEATSTSPSHPATGMTNPRHGTGTPDFRHGWIEADTTIHYVEVTSEGPPLVFVHGIGMDWRVWQAVARRFVPRFHLYAVDLRGHGDSEKPEHGYSLAHYAADLEDLLEALVLRNVTLIGSSLGGAVCAIVEAPVELVSHRVLVDPPLTLGPIRDERMFRDILKLKHQPVEELARYLTVLNPGAGQHAMRTMSEMWHRASNGVIEDMLADPTGYYGMERELRNIKSPTLLMQADQMKGAVLKDDDARKALTLLPHGAIVTVSGAGHAIHASKPAEFVSIVERFTEGTTS
jgi:pimeloyl-ACP methyl ester carboxylesterase